MNTDTRLRLSIFVIALLLVLFLLGIQLVRLQLVDTNKYQGEARNYSTAVRVNIPARGLIYDRNGNLLVDNEPTYSITLTYMHFDTTKVGLLADLLQVPDTTVVNRLNEARNYSPYVPSVSFRAIDIERFTRIQEMFYELPGVNYIVEQKRRYHGPRASHVLGYIKEVSTEQMEAMNPDLEKQGKTPYRQGDQMGQTGVERYYELQLRGEPGISFMEKNVHGQLVSSYQNGKNDVPPKSGYTLVLSIDAETQALGEELFKHKRGGAVAIDPNTGEILAMISAPDYNPDLFSGSLNDLVWNGLTSDPDEPLYNRATSSAQPPGSTFKPFMSLISLQEGKIDEQSTVYCGGGFGRHKCMGSHGSLTVRNAIKFSCNTFFYTMMSRQNLGVWNNWAHEFGFGEKPPIDILENKKGIIPDTAYADKQFKGWRNNGYPPVIYGIGQAIGVTPLQLARYVSTVANGGTRYDPHFVKYMVNTVSGDTLTPNFDKKKLAINPHYFTIVREGMRAMAMERTRNVRWGDIVLAGKTGTAQVRKGVKDHSWFIGFAPFDNPKIAIAVLVENGGFGASAAAPIAGLMMQQYIEGEILPAYQGQISYISKGVRSQGMKSDIDWTLPKDDLIPLLEEKALERTMRLRQQATESVPLSTGR